MKVVLKEYDGYFLIDLLPETIADAALLMRFGMNSTSDASSISTYASANRKIETSVSFRKRKRVASKVAAGKW